jgi:hypothetical protein
MSGAAGIAAAKNRRSKTEPNQKQLPPPINCGKNGSCPPQKPSQNSKTAQVQNSKTAQVSTQNDLVDPNSLQILGPMPPVQILRVHEQRLNKFDERFNQFDCQTGSCQTNVDESEIDDCFTRVETLESKLAMLEEVIMTLQNKLTIAQNFAMETNLSMNALIKKQQQNETIAVVDITQSFDETDENLSSDETSPTTIE